MINEERVKHMTRMAIFEKEKGPDFQPMLRYSRKEYVALHGWGGFLAGTIFFVAIYALVVLYIVGSVIENLNTMYILLIALIGLLCYAAYIIMHVYNVRRRAGRQYKKGRRLIKDLGLQYQSLTAMYDRQEQQTKPLLAQETESTLEE